MESVDSFESYRLNIVRERLSAAVVFMAIPLYLAFSYLDYTFSPQFWLEFFVIRIFTVIALANLGYLISRKRFASSPSLLMIACHIGTALLGAGIGYMTFRTGGLGSPYYSGLNWIAIGSLAFWPTTWRHRSITIGTVYGPLFLIEALFRVQPLGSTEFLCIVFMAGTVVLSLLSNSLSLRSVAREFGLRAELHALIKDKDRIIDIKSAESANLKRLAKQFSPTVIEAIETKGLALDQRIRRKVAVIFIDVVSSTNRSNQLDYTDYQRALDIFFDIAIKKFLEKNITVANFMGDGLMAIANAPNTVENYELVAFEACSHIVDETRRRQRQLRELWQDDFNIRVGIASGYATVGFFPNSDFGVYTALGDSVNLASRLCSAAPSGNIALTKGVALAAQAAIIKHEVKKGGSVGDLKGFDGHAVEYYLVTPNSTAVEAASEHSKCPLCSGDLFAAADLGDTILVKCTACHYSDIDIKSETSRLAG